MLQFFARRINALHDEDRKGQKGFTLIELLVVIIIIGILAAIAIPVFLAQRERAWEANAQSDARNAAAAATSCSTQNGGSYANCNTAALLQPFGYNKTQLITVNGMNGDTANWSVSVQHTNGGQAAVFSTFNTAAAGSDSNAGQVRLVARGTGAPALP